MKLDTGKAYKEGFRRSQLKPSRVAEICGVNPSTVWRWMQSDSQDLGLITENCCLLGWSVQEFLEMAEVEDDECTQD